MKKAIVTGANGFIGAALCKELGKQGVEIIAIVRNENENIAEIQHISKLRIVYCDLSNFWQLDEIIKDRDVDVFYHLAWVGSAGPLRGDSEIQINNIRYTCQTIEACKKMNCGKFVFASSIMEYEIISLMNTTSVPGINTLYSSAKVAADYMARTIAGNLNINYLRAVISNVYGPGEQSQRLINTSIRKMLRNERCSFSPGEQMYDFIYIDDAAKSFVAIGEKGIANKTYYIGSQNPRPLKEFLVELKDQIDPSIEMGMGEIPFDGVSLTYKEFDINAVRNDTGFFSTVDFKSGIKNTIEWIRGN